MTSKRFYTVPELTPYIDWVYLYHAWQVKAGSAQAAALRDDALRLLDTLPDDVGATALYRCVSARSEGDDLVLAATDKEGDPLNNQGSEVRLPLLRQQKPGPDGYTLCLSDYVNPAGGEIGVFAAFCTLSADDDGDPFTTLLTQTLATRLAEAAAEKLDHDMQAVAPGTPLTGIRPAVGYPSLPDLSINFLLDELLGMTSAGMAITENGAMMPLASVSGLMIPHPQASYFAIGSISEEQFIDYARRRQLPPDRIRPFLRSILHQ